MTEQDNAASNEHDAETDHLFDLLKQLEPPLESRVHFRATVASELARLQSKPLRRATAWWRRSISIPVPVAMACGVLLTAGLWFMSPPPKNEMAKRDAAPDRTETSASDIRKRQDAALLVSSEPTPKLRMSNVYLCGLGPLSTETRYVIQE